MSKLRICYVPPYFPPHWGGLEMVSYKISSNMHKRNYEVHVVTTETKGMEKISNGFDIRRLKLNFKIFNTPVSLSLKKKLKEIDVDIIHTHAYPVYFCDVARTVAKEKNIPFVLHWHIDPRDSDIYKNNPVARIVTDMYFFLWGNKLLKDAAKIVIPSQAYADLLVEKSKVDTNKIEVVPNGIDTDLFSPNGKRLDNIVLFVGRISEQKNLDTLIKAWELLEKENKDLELWIIGKQDQQDYYEKIMSMSKDLKRIKFLGDKNITELSKYYSQATLLIFPSMYESFGNVPLEAMACGCPVISSNVGIVPEFVNHDDILKDKMDPVEIKDKIIAMVKDKEKRQKLSEEYRKRIVSKLSWENNTERLEKIYRELV